MLCYVKHNWNHNLSIIQHNATGMELFGDYLGVSYRRTRPYVSSTVSAEQIAPYLLCKSLRVNFKNNIFDYG